MGIKLKPCPFCGGKAVLHDAWRKGTANRKKYWYECDVCGTAMKNRTCFRTEEKARQFWNHRVDPWETEKKNNSLCNSCVTECKNKDRNLYIVECNMYIPNSDCAWK